MLILEKLAIFYYFTFFCIFTTNFFSVPHFNMRTKLMYNLNCGELDYSYIMLKEEVFVKVFKKVFKIVFLP